MKPNAVPLVKNTIFGKSLGNMCERPILFYYHTNTLQRSIDTVHLLPPHPTCHTSSCTSKTRSERVQVRSRVASLRIRHKGEKSGNAGYQDQTVRPRLSDLLSPPPYTFQPYVGIICSIPGGVSALRSWSEDETCHTGAADAASNGRCPACHDIKYED